MSVRFDADVQRLDVLIGGRIVGTLAQLATGEIAFQYDSGWVRDGYSISPFSLPLDESVKIADSYPLDGLFGIFHDSMPDGWGRLLVDRMLRSHGYDPAEIGMLTRLAIVGDGGSGALEYVPAAYFEPGSRSSDLDRLAADCAAILDSTDAADLDLLFSMGGSSGGARPKVFYEIDGEDWIVKFPSSMDSPDIGLLEFRLSQAARACGIEMPETRLMPSARCSGYFATKRFDRVKTDDGACIKVHMASAAALLETSHRIPNLDYDMLFKLALLLTDDMTEVEKLYRLMVFNVLCGNRDDHSKNFTFLCDDGSWRLSPGYDLTPNPGVNGERATTVNGKGKGISQADMVEAGTRAGLSAGFCREVVSLTREVLSDNDLLEDLMPIL